ncbi:hypothetical protein SDC9_30529 [bioreactor metagenome]|uniref:Uncharacterized protein n=1 Tax=bioreactor metagenome TaxID=1076179 RepID=A0A644V035_9ZZZZ|nr:hypothetical protein [Methanobrevibacter sp.]MEA4957538.1 hypothetical protein [Methanobrevibacter sp.]
MKTKKIIILLMLFVAILGFTMTTVTSADAASKTVGIKSHPNYGTSKYIGKGDYAFTYYNKKYSAQAGKSRYLSISIVNNNYYPYTKYYKMTKTKVYFKTTAGKILVKNYKANKYGSVSKVVPKSMNPYKAIVYYKKK